MVFPPQRMLCLDYCVLRIETSPSPMISVRDMRQRQSDDADVTLWPPGRVPEVLREDDPDGSVAASAAPPLRHLPRQDTTAETERGDCRRRPSADVGVALLCGQQVLGRP